MKSTWHILHILMIFLTGGLWIIIYIWRLLANAHSNRQIEYAQQQRQLEAMERLVAQTEAADKLNTLQVLKERPEGYGGHLKYDTTKNTLIGD